MRVAPKIFEFGVFTISWTEDNEKYSELFWIGTKGIYRALGTLWIFCDADLAAMILE
jgi:hypothetical protein